MCNRLLQVPVPSPTQRGRAFTLVELLVAVAIVALLIAMLLPAIKTARDTAQSVHCMNNLWQLKLCTDYYRNDHRGFLPYATEGDKIDTQFDATAQAWFTYYRENYTKDQNAYDCPSGLGDNAAGGLKNTATNAGTYSLAMTETGQMSYAANAHYMFRNDNWQAATAEIPRDSGNAVIVRARFSQIINPKEYFAFSEGNASFLGGWAPGNHVTFRHRGYEAINLVFFDGHAETYSLEDSTDSIEPVMLGMSGYDFQPWRNPNDRVVNR